MRPFTALRPNPHAVLARANPAAKLGTAVVLMAVLFVSVDPLTPAIVLLGLLATLRLTGLSPRDLLLRTWPILVAAVAVAVLNTAFAAGQAGDVVVRIGPVLLRDASVAAGVGLGLRITAIALTGILALATTDPTDLAASLVQQLRVSPRFAVGALAAARLVPILATEWQTLSLARRARGVSAGFSPLKALRILFGQLLAILVAAVRRATRLAAAMESRGFGARQCRTVARPQTIRPADWWLIAAAVILGLGAVAVGLALGTWRFVLG